MITLNYNGPDFTLDDFVCKEINGANALRLVNSYDSENNHSKKLYAFNRDQSQAFCLNNDWRFPVFQLSANNYIFLEKGTVGFDFDHRIFNCSVTEKDNEFIIDITKTRDNKLCAVLWEKITQTFGTVSDKFFECTINEFRPSKKEDEWDKGDGYAARIKNNLDKIRETKFLNVGLDDSDHLYLRLKETWGNHTLMYIQSKKVQISQVNEIKMLMVSGLFGPVPQNYYKNPCLDSTLFIKEGHDNKEMFVIGKPVELYHNTSCEMWLKLRVQHRFPQDAAIIARDYPQWYNEYIKEPEPWREIEPLEEAPVSCRLGDREMFVNCTFIKKRWCIKKGLFHFPALSNDTGAGDNGDYIVCREHAISFVEYNGQEYFAVYWCDGMKRYKKDVYARYLLRRLIPISDLLTVSSFSNLVTFKDEIAFEGKYFFEMLKWAYHFYTMRHGFTPMPIDKETFDALDTA